MSTTSRNSDKRVLRQKLELATYKYVNEYDRLPSSTMLMRFASVRYIEARKFIKKKKERGQWTVDKIKANQGKIQSTTTDPAPTTTDPKPATTDPKDDNKDNTATTDQKEKDNIKKNGPVTVVENSSDDDDVDEKELEKQKKLQKAKTKIVTRRALRSMSDAEQSRFFDAIDTMLKAPNGPGTSEFYRLASYHGMPPPIYCQHGRETFPGWHRIYLMEFEKAIQVADKANGNDGVISLPYWDWTNDYKNGIPPVIRKRFKAFPKDLFPKDVTPRYQLSRDNDQNIAAKIESWGTSKSGFDCLLATQHFAHASTGDQLPPYPSIEHSHNHIHVIVGGNGGPMASVAWAAYDIAFWLHHNNVDRIYESYLKIEPDSSEEFENYQEQQARDLYDIAFTPFKKANGEYWYPRDTFDISALGYKYDKLIQAPPMQLRSAPTLVLFKDVKVSDFASKCYQIHVYVVDKAKTDDFKEPTKSGDIDVTSPNYGGGEGIFGRGMECRNCMSRPPVDLYVDVSKTLMKLKLSRYNTKIYVYIEETTDNTDALLKVSQTQLPEPVITGPLFEDMDKEQLDEQQTDLGPNNQNEVKQLQVFLKRFGYLADDVKVDGSYGPTTTQAVKDYQQASGLPVDGIVGPSTKKSIVNSRRCSNKDPFAHNVVKDNDIGAKYVQETITYWIDTNPGYLKRDKIEQTIASAFTIWSNALNGSKIFKFLDDDDDDNKDKADIKLRWTSGQTSDKRFGFDGAGGVLGHGGKGFVDFDVSERWVYGLTDDDQKELSDLNNPSTWYRGQPTVSLFYVAVHEIGHSLGLDHSMNQKDLMGPYYTPSIRKLSANDISRINNLYASGSGGNTHNNVCPLTSHEFCLEVVDNVSTWDINQGTGGLTVTTTLGTSRSIGLNNYISNDDGVLKDSKQSGGSGGFIATSTDVKIDNNGILSAKCTKTNGEKVDATYNIKQHLSWKDGQLQWNSF